MPEKMDIHQYYNKHKENHRLTTRHGNVEFVVNLKFIHQYLQQLQAKAAASGTPLKILDLGAGTGRYSVELFREGYDVTAVELVKHNAEQIRAQKTGVKVWNRDARDLSFLDDDTFDLTLVFGPLYHLHGDEEKLKVLHEARRVTKPGGYILVAYVLNEYSILTWCFAEDRMPGLLAAGGVDGSFHVRAAQDELYDYVRLDDVRRLSDAAGLERVTMFSPDGPADYMRRELNAMSAESYDAFVQFQMCNAERPELLGAGSHLTDVLIKK
ncbi:MAG: methyltransferase domain-containing protein [Treponemataceae bacterium]|nr:methyltransferase domain-containing protein [Treponemataceae bacterium]